MPCEFCKSEEYTDYIKSYNVSYVKCSGCGLVYQYPVLSAQEIKDIYSDSYFEYEIANQDNFFNLMRLSLDDIEFEKLSENLPSKNVLDIGCATGMLLNHLKGKGFNCTGVEICEESANHAIKEYGLNIHKKPLEEVHFDNESFAVVHWSHVIEHVPSPATTLKEIYRILQKDGIMILTTPNERGFFSRHYKENWRSVMPQHLWLFDNKVLINYISSIGFSVLEMKSWGSIPAEKAFNKSVKKIADKLVKIFNTGDVMLLLCKK